MPAVHGCFRAKLLIVAALVLFPALAWAAEPLRLHPDNPHYLLFRGKPIVLITSGEHYGAVLNAEFDYKPYLDELQKRGFNLTRTFSGMYREVPSSFGIIENTLAPKPDKYVCPWARSNVPGTAENGAKFDLAQWNPDYFRRLADFVGEAGKRGIVVELSLFCAIYDDGLWGVNPMKAANNVNGLAEIQRGEVYTLKDKKLQEIQESLVRKIVAELKDADNVYYEVCNEPYFAGVSREWNDRIVDVIAEAEASFPARHLVAQNISNGSMKIERPNAKVSIFNFHYSTPPDSVGQNYDLNRAIADDETGFKGKEDLPYRGEAWDFFMAGGAIYSNLDYSYSASHPDGSAEVTTSPGGGGPKLRGQLQILKKLLDGFDLVKTRPDNAIVAAGVPEKGTIRALVEPGRIYALYVRGGSQASPTTKLPEGAYSAEWIDTKTGEVAKAEKFKHGGGEKVLASPNYQDDIALKIMRVD